MKAGTFVSEVSKYRKHSKQSVSFPLPAFSSERSYKESSTLHPEICEHTCILFVASVSLTTNQLRGRVTQVGSMSVIIGGRMVKKDAVLVEWSSASQVPA
jgi:hypothetical protein